MNDQELSDHINELYKNHKEGKSAVEEINEILGKYLNNKPGDYAFGMGSVILSYVLYNFVESITENADAKIYVLNHILKMSEHGIKNENFDDNSVFH